MTPRPRLLVLAAVSLALTLLATSCTQVLDVLEGDASAEQVWPTPAAADYAAPSLLDERIDFTLSRSDVDCSPLGTVLRDGTQVLSAHYVVDGKLGATCQGRTNTVLVNAWKEMVSLTPPDHLKELGLFVGYTNTQDIALADSIIGFASNTGWWASGAQVSVDIDYAFADPINLRRILVHEMGHVISLTKAQGLPMLSSSDSCQGFAHNRICFNADSLMQEWVNWFWADLLDEFDPNLIPSRDVGRSRCERFDRFWGPYSASSPTEDFAESYAAFVLRVQANSVDQQAKLDWFATKPELVEARERATQLGHGQSEWYQRCGA